LTNSSILTVDYLSKLGLIENKTFIGFVTYLIEKKDLCIYAGFKNNATVTPYINYESLN